MNNSTNRKTTTTATATTHANRRAMKLVTADYDIGYPVYDAKFLNANTLLVTGGGGEQGQAVNRLTALTLQLDKKKQVKKFRELKLSEDDDTPYVLDAANNVILVGCNESAESIRAGHNHNLKKYIYKNDHLVYVTSASLEPIYSPLQHQKLIRLSQDGTMAATATSNVPTVIHILGTTRVFEKYEIETNNEVKDLDISPDGKLLAYITTSTLEIISVVTGKSLMRKIDFISGLSKVRFQDNDLILVASNLRDTSGICITRVSLSRKLKVVKEVVVSKKIKGITSMDINIKNAVLALAGNENSVIFMKLKSLKVLKTIPNVHNLSITKVVFSPDGKYFASVSAAKTINVIEIADGWGIETHKIYYFFLRLFQLLIAIGICAIAWIVYNSRKHDNSDYSEYFTLIQGTSATTATTPNKIAELTDTSRSTKLRTELKRKTIEVPSSVRQISTSASAITSSVIPPMETSRSETTLHESTRRSTAKSVKTTEKSKKPRPPKRKTTTSTRTTSSSAQKTTQLSAPEIKKRKQKKSSSTSVVTPSVKITETTSSVLESVPESETSTKFEKPVSRSTNKLKKSKRAKKTLKKKTSKPSSSLGSSESSSIFTITPRTPVSKVESTTSRAIETEIKTQTKTETKPQTKPKTKPQTKMQAETDIIKSVTQNMPHETPTAVQAPNTISAEQSIHADTEIHDDLTTPLKTKNLVKGDVNPPVQTPMDEAQQMPETSAAHVVELNQEALDLEMTEAETDSQLDHGSTSATESQTESEDEVEEVLTSEPESETESETEHASEAEFEQEVLSETEDDISQDTQDDFFNDEDAIEPSEAIEEELEVPETLFDEKAQTVQIEPTIDDEDVTSGYSSEGTDTDSLSVTDSDTDTDSETGIVSTSSTPSPIETEDVDDWRKYNTYNMMEYGSMAVHTTAFPGEDDSDEVFETAVEGEDADTDTESDVEIPEAKEEQGEDEDADDENEVEESETDEISDEEKESNDSESVAFEDPESDLEESGDALEEPEVDLTFNNPAKESLLSDISDDIEPVTSAEPLVESVEDEETDESHVDLDDESESSGEEESEEWYEIDEFPLDGAADDDKVTVTEHENSTADSLVYNVEEEEDSSDIDIDDILLAEDEDGDSTEEEYSGTDYECDEEQQEDDAEEDEKKEKEEEEQEEKEEEEEGEEEEQEEKGEEEEGEEEEEEEAKDEEDGENDSDEAEEQEEEEEAEEAEEGEEEEEEEQDDDDDEEDEENEEENDQADNREHSESDENSTLAEHDEL